MSVSSFNQVTVSSEALQHNYCLLRSRTAPTGRLLAMVKADAYGHGMVEAARSFRGAGCRDFGVAELLEGVRLRKSGIEDNIYIFLGFDHANSELFFKYNLIPVVFDMASIQALAKESSRQNKAIGIHLKVDCGMSRLGILPEEVEKYVQAIDSMEGVSLAGICSHFPRADEPESSHTVEQNEKFIKLTEKIPLASTLIKHTANSGGILYFPESGCDMVRAGISLYGYYPDGQDGVARGKKKTLQPAMSFTTKVLQIKTIPEGAGVSYGHTYTSSRQTRLAVLPVGYEDGMSRALSNCGEVLIRGKRAPVCGRICMNLTMVDVTEIENVLPGDEVVILGSQGQNTITADTIAEKMNSISYEVLCQFGNNNQRKYHT